jgi:hypothetical protein
VKYRLSIVLSGLSLALCIAMCALWVRSYRPSRIASWRLCNLYSQYGELILQGWPHGLLRDYLTADSTLRFETSRQEFFFGSGTVVRLKVPMDGNPSGAVLQWTVDLHEWFLCILLALPPIGYAVFFARARRKRGDGFCVVCGYDLRATADRCPECGTVATKKRVISG